MSDKIVRRNIGIREDQDYWLKKNYIDLSKMIRDLLDDVINNSK